MTIKAAAPCTIGPGRAGRLRRVEKLLERCFCFGVLRLDCLEGFRDSRQAQFLVFLWRAVNVLLLAVSLDLFTAVLDLGQAKCCRRPLQEVAKPV